MRALANRAVEGYSPGSPVHSLCLVANALAQGRVWDAGLGATLVQAATPQGGAGLADGFTDGAYIWQVCNPIDVAQLMRFVAVFRRDLAAQGLDAAAFLRRAHAVLLEAESYGRQLEPRGLVSLLRSAAQLSAGAADAAAGDEPLALELCRWLRSRLLRDLALCSPRQLASVLLDLQSLGLIDDDALVQLRREVDRCLSAGTFRARDLVSVLSGYARLPRRAEERRSLIRPLLPEMVSSMPSCSGADLCELLHSFAMVHLHHKPLLGVWASHLEEQARSLTPTQLSLVSADLAKVRYVRDPKRTFGAVLRSVSEVASSLGGLGVCHVVCAMARAGSSPLLGDGQVELHRLLLCRMEAQLLARVCELQPQGLSASAAAFAKLRHFSEELFDGLAGAAVQRFASFVPEDFAMLSSALSVTHRVLESSAWRGEPLWLLGRHAAESLEVGHRGWSPRQVAEVLQPFAVLQVRCRPLLLAAEAHFRSSAGAYAPRDLVRVLHGFRDTGHLDVPQVACAWDISRERLRLFDGLQTLALAEVLVNFRHGLPAGELQQRFRLLGAGLMRSLPALPPEGFHAVARIWALAGLRDWPLLAANAGGAASATGGVGLGDTVSPEDISRILYAYVKLGAPEQVPDHLAAPVYDLLIRATEVLQSAEALSSLDARGLRRVLLSVAMWGPPVQDEPQQTRASRSRAGEADCDAAAAEEGPEAATPSASDLAPALPRDAQEARATVARRALLLRGLSALLPLPLEEPAAREQLRLVAASAHLEFGVDPSELTPAAALHYRRIVAEGASESFSPRSSQADLQSYEKSVYAALERLLREWTDLTAGAGVPLAEPKVLHPAMPCTIRVAVPAWRVAVEVGRPEDLVRSGGSGWRSADEEALWQRLPALRMRLLRRLGWHVLEVPFFEWQALVDGPEQRQFLRARLREPARAAAAEAR